MRIGYGYRRRDKDFAEWDCDRVFVDTPKTMRQERRDLFETLRDGDVLFMFGKGDLGHGKELPELRQRLEKLGVEIEYPPFKAERRGRPKGFNPSPEDDEYLRILWKDMTFSQGYVLRKAADRTGIEVKRHQMIYRYGKRSK